MIEQDTFWLKAIVAMVSVAFILWFINTDPVMTWVRIQPPPDAPSGTRCWNRPADNEVVCHFPSD